MYNMKASIHSIENNKSILVLKNILLKNKSDILFYKRVLNSSVCTCVSAEGNFIKMLNKILNKRHYN